MKKIMIVFTCLLLTVVTMSPISAIENSNEINISDLYAEINNISKAYKSAEISSSQILELMAKTPKFDNSKSRSKFSSFELYFQNHPTKSFDPSDYNLENLRTSRDGDMYDGNPPYSEQEQVDRLNYIESVYQKEYNSSKYNHGVYTTYLYTSHYIENVTFDRTKSNEFFFGYPVLAHIICENDIDAFNSFYRINEGSAVVSNFTSLVDGLTNIKESGMEVVAAKEFLNLTFESMNDQMKEYVDELKNIAITDSSLTKASKDLFDKYINIVTSNPEILTNPEAVINDIYDGLGGGISRKAINHYISGVSYLTTSALAASLVSPILGGVIYFTETLCKVIPTLSLAGLYYGYQVRKADRFSVYVGLHQRP